MSQKLGPNMKRLMTKFAAKHAIPDGGGFEDGLQLFTQPGKMMKCMNAGLKDAENAVDALRQAPDNEWGDDAEVLAGVILHRIEMEELEQRRHNG